MPLFLFYFFYFPLCLFLLHLQYKKKLNHRMHTPPRRFPGAPTAPDRPGAPARQPPSRPVRCSNHQLRGKNIFLQLRLPPLHPFRPKGYVGKKRLAAGYTGTTDHFRGMQVKNNFHKDIEGKDSLHAPTGYRSTHTDKGSPGKIYRATTRNNQAIGQATRTHRRGLGGGLCEGGRVGGGAPRARVCKHQHVIIWS